MKMIKLEQSINLKKENNENNYKYIKFFSFFLLIILINNNILSSNYLNNNLIRQNFFVIDSNNLRKVKSHMYGYCISKEGILTDNYYKKIKKYKDPEPDGVYIMIRKNMNEILINQDFYGSIGLYLYENKNTGYFAISNSFILLEEHLVGKFKLTINEDFANDLIIEELCTPSINETLIKEITKLPSNIYIIINIQKKSFKFYNLDYKENTIELESEEGLKIIDKWVDKWSYIIRSLKKKTNNICSDLSGGYDTRIVLAILLNSGVELKDILIRTSKNNLHGHDEDFKIANNISNYFGFKLNSLQLNEKGTFFKSKDSLFCSIYSKLGIHKEFYFKKKFYLKPRFQFTGCGGELIRGSPGKTVEKYMESLSSNSKRINKNQKFLHDSTISLCNRSIELLKKNKKYQNSFEIAADLYYRGRTRSHFGTASYENFIANIYFLNPLIDSDIKKIKFEIKNSLPHDLLGYIYIRFGYDLIKFPFQGKRILNPDSIKKAEKLNTKISDYKKKYNYQLNFYIDNRRKSPVSNNLNSNGDANNYIKEKVNSKQIYNYIKKIYDDSIYNWSIENINKTQYYPFKHIYALLAIAKILEDISINNNNKGLIQNKNNGVLNNKINNY